jgi:hypothetical protein
MKKFSPVQIGIIIATLITAVIHLAIAPLQFRDPATSYLGVLFFMNFVGYLSLLMAYFLPQPFFRRYHNLIRWLFIGFAAVTILAWAVMNGDFTDPIGVISKLSEIALIVLLFLDRQ